MDFFDHPYYRVSKLLLSMVGQWPDQNPNIRLLSLCFVTLLTTSIIITEVLLLYSSKGALEFTADAIAGIALMTTISVKCHTCYFAGDMIKKLLNKIEDEWKLWKSKEEITIMENYAKEGRFYIIGYIKTYSVFFSRLVYIYTTVILSFLTSFLPKIFDLISPLNESRPLRHVIMNEYFVDSQEYFYPIYFHMTSVIMIGITCFLANDAIFLVFTSHVCGLFTAVGYRLEHLLKENNTEKISSNRQSKECSRSFIRFIKAHKRAVEFADLMESYFSLPSLLITGMNIICLSVSLLRVAVLLGKSVEVFKFTAFTGAQLFHMYCISFVGQRIIDHSSDICFKAYSGLWYDAPMAVRKMLLLVIRRSLRPSYLTAGKIFVFCFESFSTVVQTSMSYFMVLSSIQEA
ncbi:odorant receptor 13a-like [Vespula pensylvanica]|uniref:odorant receptor 13a-like n=1 Tax=Vespula pensylvanica TaxID=30213 RepID=UPI001CBA13F3|nr:odorant receptor 13a-like [Vespula pensylvanica]